jgi:hypothetical protein
MSWSFCSSGNISALNKLKDVCFNILRGTRTQDSCRVCDLRSCNLLRRSFIAVTFLSTETILVRTPIQCRGLCLCNLLFEAKHFDPRAVVLSRLISRLKEAPLPTIELRTIFPESWPSCVLLFDLTNNHARVGAGQVSRSRAVESH